MTRLPLVEPTMFRGLNYILCAMSTRKGGVSAGQFGMNTSFNVGDDLGAVRENRRRFFEAAGCIEDQVVQPKQCHSSVVVAVDGPGWIDGADGLVTNREGLCLGISVADCLPVFLVDPVRRAIAAVHAGWRGSAGSIVQNAVRLMGDRYGTLAPDLKAFLGPSARSCCYEIGPEVAGRFESRFVDHREGRLYLDIAGVNQAQLVEMGLERKNIEIHDLCTITEGELFHSYRRERSRSGRMLGVIMMVSDQTL